MQCPICVAAGKKSRIVPVHPGTLFRSSGVGQFYEDDGILHDHEPTASHGSVSCSNGHSLVVVAKPGCPAADCSAKEEVAIFVEVDGKLAPAAVAVKSLS